MTKPNPSPAIRENPNTKYLKEFEELFRGEVWFGNWEKGEDRPGRCDELETWLDHTLSEVRREIDKKELGEKIETALSKAMIIGRQYQTDDISSIEAKGKIKSLTRRLADQIMQLLKDNKEEVK